MKSIFSKRTASIFFSFVLCNLWGCQEAPLSVVIIGGGPTGLATAIEAHSAGADVIIIEKREQYSRDQYIFLMEPALTLLDEWKVCVPELMIGEKSRKKIGAMKLKELENALARRIHELSIPVIFGEFQGLRNKKVFISCQNQNLELSYDLLVGADGMHSVVREHLNITSTLYGSAIGSLAVIPFPARSKNMEFIFKCSSPSFTKIILPSATLIAAQSTELSREIMVAGAIQHGWLEEALFLSSEKGQYQENIEVILQQSDTFFSPEHSAIILGDAAASASFLLGMGTNCALEAARLAGLLFKTNQKESDYLAFNQSMQEVTSKLVDKSRCVFNQDVNQPIATNALLKLSKPEYLVIAADRDVDNTRDEKL